MIMSTFPPVWVSKMGSGVPDVFFFTCTHVGVGIRYTKVAKTHVVSCEIENSCFHAAFLHGADTLYYVVILVIRTYVHARAS